MIKSNIFPFIFISLVAALFAVVGVMDEFEWIQPIRKIAHIRARSSNKDEFEDIEPLSKRAAEGCAEAQNELAEKYWWSKDVLRDDEKARKWFRRAAEQGHKEAQFRLGTMYLCGQGGVIDERQAYTWFFIAAECGHPHAAESRDNVAKKLDQNRLFNAQTNAEIFLKELRRNRPEPMSIKD